MNRGYDTGRMESPDGQPMRMRQKRSDTKLRIVALAVFAFISITGPLALALGVPVHGKQSQPIDRMVSPLEIEERLHDVTRYNQNMCTSMRQYGLDNNIVATVCVYGGRTRLDIRQFLNGRATIKGIYLPLSSYQMLILHWDAIRHEMEEASYQDIKHPNSTRNAHSTKETSR